MKRSTERILTTHTGSLPRAPALTETLTQADRGELTGDAAAAFPGQVRDAVAEAVRQQVGSRVDVVNDGEMSKIGYSTYVKERLTGFDGEGEMVGPSDLVEYPGCAELVQEALTFQTPACDGPVSFTGGEAVQADIDNLRAALDGQAHEEAFISSASPGVIALFLLNRHYDSHEAYLQALADAMKEEYDAIHASGFLLQLDCPDLAMGRHIQFSDLSLEEFRRNIELQVEALNHATRDIPPDRIRLHLCWGNYNGPHHHDVELADIVDIVLKARPEAISLEAANPRHEHEWRVFEETRLPEDKVLIPGVVDSTNNYIEHPEVVAERIQRFASVVGRENVIAGTDCGFGTFATLVNVDPNITWAKLETMAQGAELASERLW